ncbi:ParA family protein [Streptococcus thermophilus]|uniref:MinD/ParA family ATP-binding protein n=1 Tax=Streptococcus thermophilus TaxID=1308 RepID=UPI001C64D938|nr:ParA family protein [Streptococcus thermophilus]MBW7797531.1 ParA family protein [Streptococcus thermophilus]
MKIQTTNLGKGGGGKTTDTFNEGDWLARLKGKRTLLIDGAWECNLTRTFDVKSEKTVYDLFTTGEYEIVPISENLSIICGDERLTDEHLDLASRNNKYLQLFMRFSDLYDELDSQFDNILIDTHNDESLVTANFIAVSDIVLAVSDASLNGFRAWLSLKKFVDYIKSEAIDIITKKSYVTADPYLIGNKIKFVGQNVTETCKQFLDVVQEDPAYLGSIQDKELMAKSLVIGQSVFEQYENMTDSQKESHQKFYDNINYVYENILAVLEGE